MTVVSTPTWVVPSTPVTGSDGSASAEVNFGIAVRRAREARGLSQETLAGMFSQELGLNVGGQSGVARIERGVRPTRVNEFVAISEFLGIDMAQVQRTRKPELTNTMVELTEELRLLQGRLESSSQELEAVENTWAAVNHRRMELRRLQAAIAAKMQTIHATMAEVEKTLAEVRDDDEPDEPERPRIPAPKAKRAVMRTRRNG